MILNEENFNAEQPSYLEVFKAYINKYTKDGTYTMYADHNDYFNASDVQKALYSENPEETLMDLFDSDTWVYAEQEFMDGFLEYCRDNGYNEPDDDTIIELRDMGLVGFDIDWGHYLSREYYARIIVNTGDGKYDYTLNPSYYNNYEGSNGEDGPADTKASLFWLAKTQGYSAGELLAAIKDEGKSTQSKFLKSAAIEAINTNSGMNALTIMVNATLEDMINWHINKSPITISTECSGKGIGLYDGWSGSGSVLEIELEKPFVIPAEFVAEFNVDYGDYSIEDVYGPSGSCYTKCYSFNSSLKEDFDYLNRSDDFKYRLLDRMRQDCEYYLGAGNRHSKYLWAKTPEEHIAIMKELYSGLPEKPEWISMEDIEQYEKEMKNDLTEDYHLKEDINVQDNALGSIVNNLIQKKFESIQAYKDAVVAFETENKSEYTNALNEIINDENIHVGRLQDLFNTLSPVETTTPQEN